MNCLSRLFLFGSILFSALLTGPVAAADAPVKALRGSRFQPRQFTSNGDLVVARGQTITFDTGSEEKAPSFRGVKQGSGQLGRSASGKVELAVFCFDQIQLAEGAKVQVVGDRGLVLIASTDMVANTTIDLSGRGGFGQKRPMISWVDAARADGVEVPEAGSTKEAKAIRKQIEQKYKKHEVWRETAPGGPGGEGGVERKSFQSGPPPANGGDGGAPKKDSGVSGTGYGAGFNRRVKGGAAGSGAGYGGKGGDSSPASRGGYNRSRGEAPMPGGADYGEKELTELFGGSGGGGGSNDRRFANAGGGGGGGALSLVAGVRMTLGPQARLLAAGGPGGTWEICGGGGSGGSILLVTGALEISDSADIDASGGDGGSVDCRGETGGRKNKGSGGGGGGGRVAIYSGLPQRQQPKAVDVSGGKGGILAKDGQDGSFHWGQK
ncbi:MAG: hypothetical protein ACLFUJ_07440 [Phycisphaerae bacterium]